MAVDVIGYPIWVRLQIKHLRHPQVKENITTLDSFFNPGNHFAKLMALESFLIDPLAGERCTCKPWEQRSRLRWLHEAAETAPRSGIFQGRLFKASHFCRDYIKECKTSCCPHHSGFSTQLQGGCRTFSFSILHHFPSMHPPKLKLNPQTLSNNMWLFLSL